MAKRSKREVIKVTREEMEQAFSSYAHSDAHIMEITARMDEEMTVIRDKYSEELNNLSDVRKRSFDVLQAYAIDNRDKFMRCRTQQMKYGSIGFRFGTPSIKQVKGYTVSETLKLALHIAPEFVRTKLELDKETLLNKKGDKKVQEIMSRLGVYVGRSETFFVELKKEESE